MCWECREDFDANEANLLAEKHHFDKPARVVILGFLVFLGALFLYGAVSSVLAGILE